MPDSPQLGAGCWLLIVEDDFQFVGRASRARVCVVSGLRLSMTDNAAWFS